MLDWLKYLKIILTRLVALNMIHITNLKSL